MGQIAAHGSWLTFRNSDTGDLDRICLVIGSGEFALAVVNLVWQATPSLYLSSACHQSCKRSWLGTLTVDLAAGVDMNNIAKRSYIRYTLQLRRRAHVFSKSVSLF